jgi:hypothetical protein
MCRSGFARRQFIHLDVPAGIGTLALVMLTTKNAQAY